MTATAWSRTESSPAVSLGRRQIATCRTRQCSMRMRICGWPGTARSGAGLKGLAIQQRGDPPGQLVCAYRRPSTRCRGGRAWPVHPLGITGKFY